ncbi:protein FRIGIDA [Tripterygium wilfordii]|uniref:FRIGIDA-like protein n=1 Tax=Tripterygium wilfordii TaxID=458696 RepID=A0A7J7CDL4_TRIWF|nr:protein FRIGIDA-like [Tripterygium wilfordii]KAF5732261.1 protein FRIGIDA [Tripterygium wilfordii]
MATNSNLSIDVPLIASVKHEPPSPPMPQPQLETEAEPELKHKDEAVVVGDTQGLPIVHLPPQFFESIKELSSLSTLIQTFKVRFDELKKHLDFIQNALDTHSNEVPPSPHQPLSQPEQQQIQIQNQNQNQHRLESIPSSKQPPETKATAQNKGKTEGEAETEATAPGTKESSKSEVQLLCETMCSRDLRKYIVTRLHNATKLREEVPAALKCAPNPAKLVLNCIGRFYLQGTKAYITDSPMIPARKAAILTMEYFLLMMDNQVEIKAEVKKEAETGAVLWRNRLISEGGLSRAAEIDARGLLLFVACYGIPAVFKNEDVWNLIQLSNLRRIADVLRRSPALVARVSVIIEGMMKNGMAFEAVEVTSLLGIDDKFPLQKILNSFLHESKELYKRNRQDARGSPHLLKYANEKQLDALKSVMKCLEGHKIDPVEILPGWQIKEKISNLEKETADLNKKVEERVNAKRKADMNDSLSKKSRETKCSLGLTARGSPMISPLLGGVHELRAASHLDSQSSYDALLPRSSFDCELSGRVNSYPSSASSIAYGYGAVPLPESVHGGGLHADGVRSGISSRYCLLSSGLYSDNNSHGVVDRSGQMMNNNGTSYGWHGVGETAFGDSHRSVGQSVAAHPAVFSRASEGFAGILYSPTPGTANQSLSSDLYSFADVVDNNSSHQSGPLQPVVPTQHRSYMH